MTKTLMRRSMAFAVAGLLAATTIGARAEESSHQEHHPGGAAPQDSRTVTPEATPKPDGPPDSAKTGGMMSGDQMPMMKMMKDMHAKMMGGEMMMMPKGDAGPSSMAFNGIMAKMHQEMGMTFTGNADVDFVKGMIPHHQAAVDMAKTVLAFGKDPGVRKMAEEVIKAQEAEINWLKEWLKKQGK